jgi:5-methylcytosine-specific restriction protein A
MADSTSTTPTFVPLFSMDGLNDPDDGFGDWPDDPFLAPTVLALERYVNGGMVFPISDLIGAWSERRNLSQNRTLWALRQLVAHGMVAYVCGRVPITRLQNSHRGQWIELVCPNALEKRTRQSYGLPLEQPSSLRPRAALAISDTRAIVWAKTDGHCWYCGSRTNPFDDFCIDHVRSVATGGSDDLDNLVPCCRRCNSDKRAMAVETFRLERALFAGMDADQYRFYFERMGLRP